LRTRYRWNQFIKWWR